jgi:hypothetical protein
MGLYSLKQLYCILAPQAVRAAPTGAYTDHGLGMHILLYSSLPGMALVGGRNRDNTNVTCCKMLCITSQDHL